MSTLPLRTFSTRLVRETRSFECHSYSDARCRNTKIEELPQEAVQVLLFLETFCKFSMHTDRKALEGYLPPYILDHFTH